MTDEPEDEIEIDWDPLQAAIDAMADYGLDLEDHDVVLHHLATLLGSFLKHVQNTNESSDEDMAEMAAWIAGSAVEIAATLEDLPPFAASEWVANDDDQEDA